LHWSAEGPGFSAQTPVWYPWYSILTPESL